MSGIMEKVNTQKSEDTLVITGNTAEVFIRHDNMSVTVPPVPEASTVEIEVEDCLKSSQ